MADLLVSLLVRARGVDAQFSVAAGEVLALLGPNGAGKSTTAAVVAGLIDADRALVQVGGRTLTDTRRGLRVPVHHRRVGLLQQNPLLFPHMTALANVMFAAPRSTRRREHALGWLDEVGAADLAERRPGELSGGEAQRVALARALAADPQVLLLDEPLSGLDVAGAAGLRAQLRAIAARDGRSVVLITHDLLDVLGVADRVAVMEDGRIAETGSVAGLLAAPRTRFGARIAGVNAVHGVAEAPGVLATGRHVWHGVPGEPVGRGADAVALFSPASVAVYRDRPHGSPRNTIPVRITALELAGGVVRVRAAEMGAGGAVSAPCAGGAVISADVTPEAVADIGLSVGESVWFTVKTQEVSVHGAAGTGPARP